MSQRFDLGVHYYLKQEYDRAAKAFSDVLLDEPLNPRAWAYRGISLSHLGRGAEAEQALSRAIELGPQNGEAWFHLGVARALRSEWPAAVSAYRHAVAILPDDMVAWHRLGVALAESGDEPGASVAFERALVLSRETTTLPLEEPLVQAPKDSHLTETGEQEGGPGGPELDRSRPLPPQPRGRGGGAGRVRSRVHAGPGTRPPVALRADAPPPDRRLRPPPGR